MPTPQQPSKRPPPLQDPTINPWSSASATDPFSAPEVGETSASELMGRVEAVTNAMKPTTKSKSTAERDGDGRNDSRGEGRADGEEVGGEEVEDVYGMIHSVYKAVKVNLDTALTWEQLNTPEVTYSTIRPLVQRYSQGKFGGIVYVFMICRIQFLQLAERDLAFQGLNNSRAALCELLAIKVLRAFADNELELVSVLTSPYSPFSGAPEEVWRNMSEDEREDVEEEVGNALEMSIVSSAKRFLSTPLTHKVIDLIHSGSIVYLSRSSRSIISDNYTSARRAAAGESGFMSRVVDSPVRRRFADADAGGLGKNGKGRGRGGRGVYVYDPREAGWLDHTRLRVPKWRSMIEFLNFSILTILFIWNLSTARHKKHYSHVHLPEILFITYCTSFALDEFAATNEHGWTIYLANAWNAFDISFVGLFLAYLGMRVVGILGGRVETSALAFDILSLGASILLPRLCFFLIKNNVLIISLKGMISDFVRFMMLAAVCFSGILFTLWTLGRESWHLKEIAWLMLQIWFGSSYLGFSASTSFHPILGPIIMVAYAALSNTLLVTILISILSNRFAAINSNAKEEHMFQRAINTVDGVKSDYIFSYPLPMNILAVLVIAPLSWVLSEHKLHQVNVFAIRLTSFPLLLSISAYERYKQQLDFRKIRLRDSETQHGKKPESRLIDNFLGSSADTTISKVFAMSEDTPDQILRDEIGGSSDIESGVDNAAKGRAGHHAVGHGGGAGGGLRGAFGAGGGSKNGLTGGSGSPLSKVWSRKDLRADAKAQQQLDDKALVKQEKKSERDVTILEEMDAMRSDMKGLKESIKGLEDLLQSLVQQGASLPTKKET